MSSTTYNPRNHGPANAFPATPDRQPGWPKAPMFSYRHYEAIAKVLGEAQVVAGRSDPATRELFLAMFEDDNPNFDAGSFKAATQDAIVAVEKLLLNGGA